MVWRLFGHTAVGSYHGESLSGHTAVGSPRLESNRKLGYSEFSGGVHTRCSALHKNQPGGRGVVPGSLPPKTAKNYQPLALVGSCAPAQLVELVTIMNNAESPEMHKVLRVRDMAKMGHCGVGGGSESGHPGTRYSVPYRVWHQS